MSNTIVVQPTLSLIGSVRLDSDQSRLSVCVVAALHEPDGPEIAEKLLQYSISAQESEFAWSR